MPRLAPDEDIRKVAQLMIDSESQLLPVFEGRELVGVVTVDEILRKVEPFLDAATVAEAHSTDLVSVEPEATLGDALIEGLAGHGLVAPIAVDQITDQLGLEHDGNIMFNAFPPVVTFEDGLVRDLVRVSAGSDPEVMTVESDLDEGGSDGR